MTSYDRHLRARRRRPPAPPSPHAALDAVRRDLRRVREWGGDDTALAAEERVMEQGVMARLRLKGTLG